MSLHYITAPPRLWRVLLACAAPFVALSAFQSTSCAEPLTLLGTFEDEWRQDWMERKLASRRTEYAVVEDPAGERVLQATSEASASGLWRMLDLHPESATLSWRWKIDAPLAHGNEREKQGDDFAARVFVVFEPRFLSWRTRALCYVWAAHTPVGERFDNPYASSVQSIVLRSGHEHSGRWVFESRDVMADYEAAYGEPAMMISAVAVMVDTDNTGASATAWFDDLTVVVPDRPTPRGNER